MFLLILTGRVTSAAVQSPDNAAFIPQPSVQRGSGPGVPDEGGAAVAGCLTALESLTVLRALRFADLCPGSLANLTKQKQVLLL